MQASDSTAAATAPKRVSAAEAAAAAKLSKAQLAQRAALFHQTARARAPNKATTAAAAVAATPAVDPVAHALNRLTSSSQSYEEFVASLGGVERISPSGNNALTLKAAAIAGGQAQPARPVPALLAALASQQATTASYGAGSDLSNSAAAASSASAAASTPSTAASSAAASASASSATATGASATTASAAFGSDFLVLMRMLAEDRDRMRDSTRLVTGAEEEEEGGAAATAGDDGQLLRPARRPLPNLPPGVDPAMAAAFQGDHIRVDDSYGFAPDPFAPEARPGAQDGSGTDDEEEKGAAAADERRARIRVLGDDADDAKRAATTASDSDAEGDAEASDGDADADEDGAARQLESGLFLTEEDAGASLQSEPVESGYRYDPERDRMDLEQFRAHKAARDSQAKASLSAAGTAAAVAATTAGSSTALVRADADADPALPLAPPSLADRAASRLGADEAVAARSGPAGEIVASDAVESFSYRPPTFDPAAADEAEEEPERMRLKDAAAAVPVVPSGTATSPAAAALPSAAVAASAAGGPRSAASALMSRPVLMHVEPAASFCSDDEGDEWTDDHAIETVELAEEESTSVAILAHVAGSEFFASSAADQSSAASAAAPRPPPSRVGNFLDRSAQMGFEDSAGTGGGSDSESAVDDVSEEEGEWMSMEEAMAGAAASSATAAAATAAPTPAYTPSAAPRARRTLPVAK